MFRTIAAATLVSTIGLAAYAEEGGELVLEVDGETHAYTLLPSQSDWSGSEASAAPASTRSLRINRLTFKA